MFKAGKVLNPAVRGIQRRNSCQLGFGQSAAGTVEPISAELPSVRIHTAATLLLTQGVHPRFVMGTLGHNQISLTLDTYSHVSPALQRSARRRANDRLAIVRGQRVPKAPNLGQLTDNPYLPDSAANPFGRYGNRFSPDSVNNPFGRYGSPFTLTPPSIYGGDSR